MKRRLPFEPAQYLKCLLLLFSFFSFTACPKPESDKDAPELIFLKPVDNQTVQGILNIELQIIDESPITKASLYVNSSLVNDSSLSKAPWKWDYNTTSVEDSSILELSAEATDEAGNQSQRLYIRVLVKNRGHAPPPLRNFSAEALNKHHISLSWDASLDLRFQYYEIWRSLRNSTDFPDTPAVRISQKTSKNWLDNGMGETRFGLWPDSEYHYQIRQINQDGKYSDSEIVKARTLKPQAIKWRNPAMLRSDKSSITLAWQLDEEDQKDLMLYELNIENAAKSDSITFSPKESKSEAGWISYKVINLLQDSDYQFNLRFTDSLNFSAPWSEKANLSTTPFSISLNPIAEATKYQIMLSHDKYAPGDFIAYRYFLLEGEHSHLPESSQTHYSQSNVDSTVYTFKRLKQNALYTAVIAVLDTNQNQAAQLLTLFTDSLQAIPLELLSIEKYKASFKWQPYDNGNKDFVAYRLLRRDRLPVNGQSYDASYRLNTLAQDSYTDQTILPNENYFYALEISDSSGQAKVSEVITVLTPNVARAQINTLEAHENPYLIKVYWQWDSLPDPDFSHFNILRAQYNQNLGEFDDAVLTGTSSQFTFEDTNVINNLVYQYTIQTEDDRGNLRNSISKILNFNLKPPAVNLQTDSISHSQVWLSWKEPLVNNAPIADFSAYVLMRSEYQGLLPDTLNQSIANTETVFISNNLSERNFADSGLLEGNIYYYRVYVIDIAQLSQGSNELEVVTNP